MEESIKIQEEFENLIEQLERLKNINELTSANVESARSTVQQVGHFINGMNDYKKIIETDFIEKSTHINKLLLSIDKTSVQFDYKTKELSNDISKSFEANLLELNKSISSVKFFIQEGKDDNRKVIDVFSEKIKQDIDNYILESKKGYISNTNEIKNSQKQFNDSVNIIKTEVISKLVENNIVILDQQNKTKLEVLENTAVLKTLVEKSNAQLTKHLTDSQELSMRQIEQQNNKIKTLKTILFIICGLIVIGIGITILK